MLKEKIEKIKEDPGEAVRLLFALVRGLIIKYLYKFTKPNVTIGASFRAYTWIGVYGPGKVFIGDKVSMDLSFLRRPIILTHTKDSIVKIGSGTYMGGVRISCVNSIHIGGESLLGSSTIIDSYIIPKSGTKIDEHWKKKFARPIKVGNHFWSGTNSFILSGTSIEDECVLGAGAVIQDKTVPERSLLVGNPVRKIGVTRQI